MINVWSLQTVYVVNDWTDPRHKRRNVSHVSRHQRQALITVSVQELGANAFCVCRTRTKTRSKGFVFL